MSHESCRQYAEINGFDYKLDLYENKESWIPLFPFMPVPGWEQFRAIRYLKDYDAVLFVDSDILIKPYSDNIVKKYKNEGSNIIVNTRIGNKVLNTDQKNTLQFNTGVMIWYNNSFLCNNLYDYRPINSAYWASGSKTRFLLGDFIESRMKLRWWERWEDFSMFIGKNKSGIPDDERFLTLIISLFDIPIGHLDYRYNYRFVNEQKLSEEINNVQFIHYLGKKKMYMQKHYDLIMV